MTSPPRNRSLADDLRRRDQAALASLLRDRVDLISPTPDSISEVASRAATTASVRMALHRLDRRALSVAWGVAAAGTSDASAVAAALGAPGDADESWARMIDEGLAELYRLGLMWRDSTNLRPVRALIDVVPAVVADPRPVSPDPLPVAPGRSFSPELIDRFAGQQGLVAVQTVRELLRSLEAEPLGLTREGTVAIRELAARASTLGLAESALAMWLELGWSAGLLGPSAGGEELLPTVAGEVWRTAPGPQAWPVLLQAWWFADRDWSAFDRAEGVRPYVFGIAHVSNQLPELRRQWVELASEGGTAAVLNLAELLAERRPLADAARLSQLASALAVEAEMLGVTGRGALSEMGRALPPVATEVDPGDPQPELALVECAARMVPEEIETIVVQGDLTIVAPGPLAPGIAASIGAFADIESTGGAAVYRLSVASVEEALDRGWSAEQILAILQDHSRVPIPQPVAYLITDTAARHGRIRVGSAAGFVSTEDAAALELVLTALAKAGIPATRLAETVAVSHHPPHQLVGAIRAAGVAATAHDPSAADGLATPVRVAPPPRPPAPVGGVDPARVAALAAVLTATGTPTEAKDLPPAPEVPRMHSAQVQAALAAALVPGRRMWLRYADNAGSDRSYLVQPVHLAGGVCEALDVGQGRSRRFAMSRIVGVVQA
ncbi:MAG: helicase-associated domain-containing protein [Actinobacteria bacterium]|nr:helicase-associated domain-containing protein [Actinomycetota bacterium]MCB9411809.1 helicase-associated domain-containing protein [Actinomycetota bacterium]